MSVQGSTKKATARAIIGSHRGIEGLMIVNVLLFCCAFLREHRLFLLLLLNTISDRSITTVSSTNEYLRLHILLKNIITLPPDLVMVLFFRLIEFVLIKNIYRHDSIFG